jgi:hypothetical protein
MSATEDQKSWALDAQRAQRALRFVVGVRCGHGICYSA